MKRWLPPVLIIVMVAAGLSFLLRSPVHSPQRTDETPDSAATSANPAAAVSGASQSISSGADSGAGSGPAEAGAAMTARGAAGVSGNPPAPVSYAPEFTNVEPAVVLENMRLSFHAYASMFNGNPIGTNPEITAALNGGNPKQAKFIREEDGLRINAKGELVDPWGTPYFFHQLSAKEMEIHSAGPDKEMWTADDLVIK